MYCWGLTLCTTQGLNWARLKDASRHSSKTLSDARESTIHTVSFSQLPNKQGETEKTASDNSEK